MSANPRFVARRDVIGFQLYVDGAKVSLYGKEGNRDVLIGTVFPTDKAPYIRVLKVRAWHFSEKDIQGIAKLYEDAIPNVIAIYRKMTQ